jgi:hypothetical protein
MGYEALFLLSLVKTISVEMAVIAITVRWLLKIGPTTIDLRSIVFAGFFCSFATLPYLWFVLPAYIHNRTAFVVFGELTVTLVEAVFLCFFLRINKRSALILSLLANGSSFLFGLLLN